jgi:formamidopyrimidine-DNA glycosylase
MFELPEYQTLARQMNETIQGKTITRGQLGNKPHKFVWYNRTHPEFEELTRGKKVGWTSVRGRWLFVPVEPGYVLVFGECGGKIIYHVPGSKLPKQYHLAIAFQDGSALTATTQLWGAMELYEQGKEQQREYIRDMRNTPADVEFSFDYFNSLIESLVKEKKRSVKGLLTQEQLIPGLGNASAQDILFHSRLHPKHALEELTTDQRQILYDAIISTVSEITQLGGRYDEVDLYNQPGGYIRLMDKNAVGKPCPECGSSIEKIQYLGGACYFCPHCQA